MNAKNRFLSYIAVNISIMLVIFLLTSFVLMEANPALWGQTERGIYIFICFAVNLFANLGWAYHLDKIKDKTND